MIPAHPHRRKIKKVSQNMFPGVEMNFPELCEESGELGVRYHRLRQMVSALTEERHDVEKDHERWGKRYYKR